MYLNVNPAIGKALFCNTSSKKDKPMSVQVINLKVFSINLEIDIFFMVFKKIKLIEIIFNF